MVGAAVVENEEIVVNDRTWAGSEGRGPPPDVLIRGGLGAGKKKSCCKGGLCSPCAEAEDSTATASYSSSGAMTTLPFPSTANSDSYRARHGADLLKRIFDKSWFESDFSARKWAAQIFTTQLFCLQKILFNMKNTRPVSFSFPPYELLEEDLPDLPQKPTGTTAASSGLASRLGGILGFFANPPDEDHTRNPPPPRRTHKNDTPTNSWDFYLTLVLELENLLYQIPGNIYVPRSKQDMELDCGGAGVRSVEEARASADFRVEGARASADADADTRGLQSVTCPCNMCGLESAGCNACLRGCCAGFLGCGWCRQCCGEEKETRVERAQVCSFSSSRRMTKFSGPCRSDLAFLSQMSSCSAGGLWYYYRPIF